MSDHAGYRPAPSAAGGAVLRADIVDVYVVRRVPGMLRREHRLAFLQLLRADEPLRGTWHPVMGHAEAGEPALTAARRELAEEVGLQASDPALLSLRALEQIHPFYVAAVNAAVCSPRFVAEVAPAWQPTLGPEHTAARWVALGDAAGSFMWPGQRLVVEEVAQWMLGGYETGDVRLAT